MILQSIIESAERAHDIAKEILQLNGNIFSVEIIDEPGHVLGGCVRDTFKGLRSIENEAWQSVGFQQALFFSGKREAERHAVVLINKNEYVILLRSLERGVIVSATVAEVDKSISDVLAIIEGIRKILAAR